jgi:hypothetical protein
MASADAFFGVEIAAVATAATKARSTRVKRIDYNPPGGRN